MHRMCVGARRSRNWLRHSGRMLRPVLRPEPYALRTDRIDLRPLARHDAALLAELYADQEVSRFIGADRLAPPGAVQHQADNTASVRLGFRLDREEATPWSPAVVYRHDLS